MLNTIYFFLALLIKAKQLEGMNRGYLNKEFGMKMESQMVSVEGRVLPTPVLALGGRENQLTPRDGAWDMRGKQFYNGVTIEKWAIVLFVPEQRCRADVVRKFANMFQETSHKEGVMMKSGPIDVKYERPQGVIDLIHKPIILINLIKIYVALNDLFIELCIFYIFLSVVYLFLGGGSAMCLDSQAS